MGIVTSRSSAPSASTGSAPDPRALLGAWAFERSIDDRAAGDVKTADGMITLSLAREPDGGCEADGRGERIRWFEQGTLHIGGQGLPVTRTLFVVPRGAGWFVVFEDGHDFHPWTTGERVEHPCGADMYVGRIEVGGIDTGGPGSPDVAHAVPAHWSVRWDVSGPNKDYTMVTRVYRDGSR